MKQFQLIVATILSLTGACHADPRYGSVVVKGKPDSAAVFLDGAIYGKTPIVIKRITPGLHQLLIYAQGYRFLKRDVTVKPGLRATCIVELDALADSAEKALNPPQLVRLWSPKYPDETLRVDYKGQMYVIALVDSAGTVASAEIVHSSGIAKLDTHLIQAVKNSTFRPARGPDGKPVPDYIVVPFNFQ